LTAHLARDGCRRDAPRRLLRVGFQARLERPDGTAVLVAEQACALDEAAYLKKLSELEGELARLALCDAARIQIRTL
jgi:hypothetical protein